MIALEFYCTFGDPKLPYAECCETSENRTPNGAEQTSIQTTPVGSIRWDGRYPPVLDLLIDLIHHARENWGLIEEGTEKSQSDPVAKARFVELECILHYGDHKHNDGMSPVLLNLSQNLEISEFIKTIGDGLTNICEKYQEADFDGSRPVGEKSDG